MVSRLLKGLDLLRSRVPALQTWMGIAGFAASALTAFTLTTTFFVLADREFSEWMPDGEIVLLALGFLVLSRFFSQRRCYEARFGTGAYARAFANFVIPGLGIIFGSIAHLAYMPGPPIPDVWWRPILIGLGWLSLAIGGLLALRALQALGLDYLAMLYVYFPEDRRVIDSGIYDLMRHPIYGAALLVGAGLALVHANWYSLLVTPILLLFFTGWTVLVEEKELVEQMPAYADYRRQVPAFWPRLRDTGMFWRFLVLGG